MINVNLLAIVNFNSICQKVNLILTEKKLNKVIFNQKKLTSKKSFCTKVVIAKGLTKYPNQGYPIDIFKKYGI